MDAQSIKDVIRLAKESESRDGYLLRLITARLSDLHHSIELPDDNPETALYHFALDYIEHIPVFLNTLNQAQASLNLSDFIAPFLAITEENLLATGPTSRGLDDLLNKAYFTYRLVEEVNDFYTVKAGVTLIPLNMTWANIITHAILGDAFANSIDDIVQCTIKNILMPQRVYDKTRFDDFIKKRDPQQWVTMWSSWPNLSLRSKVDLKFTSFT